MNTKDFISGILLGAIAGVTAGILLAPDKGSETRDKLSSSLKDKFNRVKDGAENFADEATDKAKHLVNSGANKAKDFLEQGNDKVNEFKNKTNSALS